jgi:hypothetical protein
MDVERGSIAAVSPEDLEDAEAQDDDLPQVLKLLFVGRSSILDHWHDPPNADKPVPNVAVRKKSETPAAIAKIAKALHKIYDDVKATGGKPPNMNEAPKLVRAMLAPKRVPRELVWQVLRTPEFDGKRLKAGQRTKPK